MACSHLLLVVSCIVQIYAADVLATRLMDVYVSNSGSDSNDGSKSSPVKTLTKANELTTKGSTVHVDAGKYFLESTLEIVGKESVNWVATGNVSISGAVPLGPWTPLAEKNEAGVTLVQAAAKQGYLGRQLYVNNRRANRARLLSTVTAEIFAGATLSPTGYTLKSKMQNSPLRHGSEFVFPQSTSPWTEPRCAVQNATDTMVFMMQPCWINLMHKACGQTVRGAPGYVENVASQYITTQGEWSYDTSSETVAYALLDGESGASIDVWMPILEVLVNITGSSDISFTGFSFEHATWLRPGQGDGYVEQQTGACTIGDNPLNGDCTQDRFWSVKSPGNIIVTDSELIRFQSCEFTRLGGAGVDFTSSNHCAIDSCFFHDISGAAVQIGSFTDALLANETFNNSVVNTIVNKAGAEYSGAAGINVGYTQGTTIHANDVSNLSYVPISVGWGWSRHECWSCTNAGNNTISFNRAHDYKQTLNDGGGIYMLGPQNGSLIFSNWVYKQGTASSGALYPDEGSAYSRWFNNVVTNIGSSQWLHLWTASIHNITIENNFVDTSTFLNHGTNCPMINNTVFPVGKPPAAAIAIMNASGVDAATNRWALTL
eukprot:m.129811 g.129811  ORF g.129811 m.129811 type:complete len:602 (-) comp29431_c0_seq1:80-1885(-)